MADCEHYVVDLTSWHGESGTVRCQDCGATSLVSTDYGWHNDDDEDEAERAISDGQSNDSPSTDAQAIGPESDPSQ